MKKNINVFLIFLFSAYASTLFSMHDKGKITGKCKEISGDKIEAIRSNKKRKYFDAEFSDDEIKNTGSNKKRKYFDEFNHTKTYCYNDILENDKYITSTQTTYEGISNQEELQKGQYAKEKQTISPQNALLAQLARERRARNPKELEQEKKLREERELADAKEKTKKQFDNDVENIQIKIKSFNINEIEEIKKLFNDFFQKYVIKYKSSCMKNEKKLLEKSFEEVYELLKKLICDYVNSFFELKIIDQGIVVVFRNFIDEIISSFADFLENESSFLSTLINKKTLFESYMKLNLLLIGLKAENSVSVDWVLEKLNEIQFPLNLDSKPEQIASMLTELVPLISQKCRTVDVTNNTHKNLLEKINNIMILFGFRPIELEMEMDTSNDDLLAQVTEEELRRE
ncbi:hypothetical protein GF322_02760 [Candidatus Dependentiae bacterium]|nr:hypothetical protein [Candidatus Dependentiae bacterium]